MSATSAVIDTESEPAIPISQISARRAEIDLAASDLIRKNLKRSGEMHGVNAGRWIALSHNIDRSRAGGNARENRAHTIRGDGHARNAGRAHAPLWRRCRLRRLGRRLIVEKLQRCRDRGLSAADNATHDRSPSDCAGRDAMPPPWWPRKLCSHSVYRCAGEWPDSWRLAFRPARRRCAGHSQRRVAAHRFVNLPWAHGGSALPSALE